MCMGVAEGRPEHVCSKKAMGTCEGTGRAVQRAKKTSSS